MAEIHRSAASLRIFGDELDPKWATSRLGKEPTRSVRKGERYDYPPGRQDRIADTGRWFLEAERREPGDLDGQIGAIFDGVSDDPEVWAEIVHRFRVDLFCGLWMAECNEGISLSPDTMMILATRGIPLNLDIYEPDREG